MIVSIIVPCYNEAAALPYFLREIRKVADQMSATKPLSVPSRVMRKLVCRFWLNEVSRQ